MYVRQLRGPLSLLILSALVGLGVFAGPAARWQATCSAAPADPGQPAPLILEDPPQPLTPKQPRTEAEEDHLEALSLFATARTHQRRGEYAEALRFYQRALRCDPEAAAVARVIPPLALRLKRPAEAVRYALKLAEIEVPDPLFLGLLAEHLREVGDFRRAMKLYERAVAARAGAKQTPIDVELWMELGRLHYAAGEYGQAADSFARVSHALDHPDEFGLDEKWRKALLAKPGLTYSVFGDTYLRADRLDEATSAFEKAHQLAPNKGLLELSLARVHARKGEPHKALARLEACFKEHLASEGTAPFELLAELLEDLGKKDELVGRLEKLHAEDPDNLPLGYFLAGQYREAEQFEKAEPLYLALTKKEPMVTGYRSLVEIYRKTGRPDALLGVLGEVVEKTGLLDVLDTQAKAIVSDADLMRSVVKTAREKYKSEPKQLDYAMRFAVALLALESKQFQTAAEFFNMALEAKPDQPSKVFLAWGVGLLLEERPTEAAKVFQQGIDQKALPEDDPRFYYLLAGALAMDDQTEKALAAARKAVERKDDSASLHSRVAWILYRAKRYDEAAKAYRELIEKFDSDHASGATRDVLREARLVLSNIGVLKEDFPRAEEWLEQVLDEFPDDPGASNDLGYLWADQGRHLQRALKMIQHAVDAEPDNAAYRDSLGWAFYRLGRHPEAVAEMEKAVTLEDPPDPVILDHLGDAYLKANQPKKAKDTWKQAVEAFQKREEPQKAKEVQQKIEANQ